MNPETIKNLYSHPSSSPQAPPGSCAQPPTQRPVEEILYTHPDSVRIIEAQKAKARTNAPTAEQSEDARLAALFFTHPSSVAIREPQEPKTPPIKNSEESQDSKDDPAAADAQAPDYTEALQVFDVVDTDSQTPEVLAVLNEHRAQTAELLTEFGVDTKAATELAGRFRAHAGKELSDEQWAAHEAASHAELVRAWGDNFQANLAIAREVAAQAIQKAPWLKYVLDGPAGSDPTIVRRFFELSKAGRTI